jgi:hypothetical protein
MTCVLIFGPGFERLVTSASWNRPASVHQPSQLQASRHCVSDTRPTHTGSLHSLRTLDANPTTLREMQGTMRQCTPTVVSLSLDADTMTRAICDGAGLTWSPTCTSRRNNLRAALSLTDLCVHRYGTCRHASLVLSGRF